MTASMFPVRAAVMSAVSPPGVAVFTSAPALSSLRRIAAFPLVAATCIGVTPYLVVAFTFAPLLIRVSTVFRSFWRTAWCSGVDPSEPTFPSRASASRAVAEGEGGATWASVAGPSASRNPTIST